MEPYSQFLKRVVAEFILLSVSVSSLLFSHSNLLSFLRYFNFYYILNLPLKLFSHTLDKNCTFLFCNGLLVFLANYSGLFSLSSSSSSSSSSSNKYDNLNDLKCYEDDSKPKMTIIETTNHPQVPIPLLELEAELENTQTQPIENAMQHESGYKEREAVNTEDENSAEENLKEQQEEEEEEEEEEERAVLEKDKDKAEAGSSFFIEEVDDEEEEEEEEGGGGGGNDELSKDELNKRCDEFIRKMKEDLRMEARQQLILV